jgi:hypothetical protein
LEILSKKSLEERKEEAVGREVGIVEKAFADKSGQE